MLCLCIKHLTGDSGHTFYCIEIVSLSLRVTLHTEFIEDSHIVKTKSNKFIGLLFLLCLFDSGEDVSAEQTVSKIYLDA